MDKRCLCIVMDYADGGDLYTKIANQKKIGRGKYFSFSNSNLINTSSLFYFAREIVCYSED